MVRLLGPGDSEILAVVADDVFDGPVRPELAREFLEDPRHHIAVAIDGGTVVGMATAVHYLHPDKGPELFINEVAVASGHRRRGLGGRLLDALLDQGRALGCREAWVLADPPDDEAAAALYSGRGAAAAGTPTMFSWDLDRG